MTAERDLDDYLFGQENFTAFSIFLNASENHFPNASFGDINGTTTSIPSGAGGGPAVRYFPWDNPQNIMTKKMSDDITSILQCYVFPVVTIVGIIGSILSLIVLCQKKLRSSTTTVVLIGLAFSDMLFLVTNFVRKSTCIIRDYDEALADKINATTFYYIFYLKTAFSRVSTLIVVLISVERLIAVAFPLKVKQIVTRLRMKAAVLFLYVLVFGSLAALPPQYTYIYIRGKPYISQTKFALDNKAPLEVYNEYFLPIVFRYIPVLVVLIVNIIIIAIISQSQRFQKSVTSLDPKRKEEQRKITRMLLSVAIIFLICLLPGDLLLLCSTAIDGFEFFGTYHNLFLVLSDICLLFEMINSSVNFITYMVLNRNFFETYVNLFCCCLHFMRVHRKTSGTQKSSNTKESDIGDKVKISLKDFSLDSGIEEKSKSENEASAVLAGKMNEAYIASE
ncbi:galanin receptor 2a-like [Mercenaria mercenaria]|uniref:galanin receptor 2a-like n=1 Tax=Mercenaria mercenaria TaxID=6596 RepID=UPI00234F6940|nr:galanin receptor 2a-like [Mercenaria mercenaria]